MSRSNIAEVRMKDEEKKEMLGIGVAYTRAAEISGKNLYIHCMLRKKEHEIK